MVRWFPKNWDVVVYKKSNQIFGVFPYEIKKKWGLTYLLPILTPQLGPWLAYPDGQKNNTKLAMKKKYTLLNRQSAKKSIIDCEIISFIVKYTAFSMEKI